MRIAIVSDAWSPQVNGVVTTLRTTRDHLRLRGHEVEVFSPEGHRTLPCPSYPSIRLALLPRRRVWASLDAFAPEAIHVATEGPIGRAGRAWCLRRGLPFTTSYHTKFPEYLEVRTGIPTRWTYPILRRFHAPATRTMVNTPTMFRDLEAQGFEHLAIWSRGVDTARFTPENPVALDLPRPIFMYMGRVAVEKNIEAFLRLKLPGSKVVVGDGPDLPKLKQAHPEAHFVGMKQGTDLPRHLAAADVFVFPSLTDTFGVAMLEAMACGLPVAAFPVPGPQDVLLQGHTGVMDADLALACHAALDLDRERCRRYALSFTWDRAVDQFLQNLEPVPGASRAPSPLRRGSAPAPGTASRLALRPSREAGRPTLRGPEPERQLEPTTRSRHA